MTECGNPEIRDALPDLLHGRLDDAARARVESHLRSCDACRRELNLLRALRGAAPQPAVNVAAIVSALPVPRRHRSWTTHLWQIAAAVAFLAVGSSGVIGYMRRAHQPDTTAAATVASQRESSGASAAAASGDVELAVGYGYTDLSDAQLEALLKDVQELKAVPMSEPEVSMPDVTIGNGGV